MVLDKSIKCEISRSDIESIENNLLKYGFMRDDKSYNYTDKFSDTIHTAKFINAAELSELFFSVPRWITVLMTIRNIIMKPFGLKKGRCLSRRDSRRRNLERLAAHGRIPCQNAYDGMGQARNRVDL